MIPTKAFYIILLSAAIALSGHSQIPFNYNLDLPSESHILPSILAEISGITYIDQDHIACVQDEIGEVFIYNFRRGEIVVSHPFEVEGDFEGVAYTRDDRIFILRSDGRLSEWQKFRSANGLLKHHQLPLKTRDNEGLCYDPEFNQLLIAGKSKPENKAEKHQRLIYSYSIISGKANPEPYIKIDLNQLQKTAQKTGIKQSEITAKGKPKPFNFSPSALAIHPQKSTIFILAAEEYVLLETDRQGNVLNIQKLDKTIFQKAEGITFLPDGTMLISNEAADKKATLHVFKILQ